jgi:hypothetical protein
METQHFIIKFRGGSEDGVFRIALGRVPETITVKTTEDAERYVYQGAEEQVRTAVKYDAQSRQAKSERVVLGIYHIFSPALDCADLDAL